MPYAKRLNLTSVVAGEDISPQVYELPSDLFDSLLTCLPPLALQKLQEQMSVQSHSFLFAYTHPHLITNEKKRLVY